MTAFPFTFNLYWAIWANHAAPLPTRFFSLTSSNETSISYFVKFLKSKPHLTKSGHIRPPDSIYHLALAVGMVLRDAYLIAHNEDSDDGLDYGPIQYSELESAIRSMLDPPEAKSSSSKQKIVAKAHSNKQQTAASGNKNKQDDHGVGRSDDKDVVDGHGVGRSDDKDMVDGHGVSRSDDKDSENMIVDGPGQQKAADDSRSGQGDKQVPVDGGGNGQSEEQDPLEEWTTLGEKTGQQTVTVGVTKDELGFDEHHSKLMGTTWAQFVNQMEIFFRTVSEKDISSSNAWQGKRPDTILVNAMKPWVSKTPEFDEDAVIQSLPHDFLKLWSNHWYNKMLHPSQCDSDVKMLYGDLSKKDFWGPGRSGLAVLAAGLKWSWLQVESNLGMGTLPAWTTLVSK